jgi:hypothetical protein
LITLGEFVFEQGIDDFQKGVEVWQTKLTEEISLDWVLLLRRLAAERRSAVFRR